MSCLVSLHLAATAGHSCHGSSSTGLSVVNYCSAGLAVLQISSLQTLHIRMAPFMHDALFVDCRCIDSAQLCLPMDNSATPTPQSTSPGSSLAACIQCVNSSDAETHMTVDHPLTYLSNAAGLWHHDRPIHCIFLQHVCHIESAGFVRLCQYNHERA